MARGDTKSKKQSSTDKKKVEQKKVNPEQVEEPVTDSVEDEDDEDDKFIQDLTKDLDKKVTTMTLGGNALASVPGWIPSGSIDLDAVLGKGWPLGRIVEVFGPESNGKTTVALHAVAEIQRMGGIAIFLDTEHALDRERAKSLGVNLKKLIYSIPETMEKLFEYVEFIVETIRKKDANRPVLIVWDSVASTATNAEVNGEYDDQHVASGARVMSQSLKKINPLLTKQQICFMCINQTRDKVGVTFGEKSSTPMGRALKFYAAVRLEVIKIGQYKEGDNVAGIKCIATPKKNKVAPPFKKAYFNILFDQNNGGIDGSGSILEAGFDLGLFGNSKGWFEIEGKKYRKAEARAFFKENPDEFDKYRDTIQSMKG